MGIRKVQNSTKDKSSIFYDMQIREQNDFIRLDIFLME